MLALTILNHPRLAMIGARACLCLTRGGNVLLSRNEPEFTMPGDAIGRPLGDPSLSRTPLVFQTAEKGALQLSRGMNQTSVRVDEVEIGPSHEFESSALNEGVCLSLSERILLLLRVHQGPYPPPTGREMGMIGRGEAVATIRSEVEKVAPLGLSVLIRGETGTGKELVARALHRHSSRADKPFIAVNMGALPHTLAASELFGVRRGAFTGAAEDKTGYFRAAHGGTLFLDEVGEAPPEVQASLLRLLETGEVAPVGSHEHVRIDVRLIAATDADLEARIASGDFKESLLHRLAAYEIAVPPLRQRREDIGPLFLHFARETLHELGEVDLPDTLDPLAGPWLPVRLAVLMARYPWPGNIRQLRNLVRKMIVGNHGRATLSPPPQIAQLLGDEPESEAPMPGPWPQPSAAPRRKPRQISAEEFEDAMRRADWEPKAAAALLEIARSSIYDLIRKSPHIRTAADLSAEEITTSHRTHGGVLEAMASELRVSKSALNRRLEAMGLSG